MPDPSSSVTFSRRASAGAGAKPPRVLRVRKGSGRGSGELESHEPDHPVKAGLEIPATETFHEMFVTSRPKFVATAYSILRNIEDAEDAVQNAYISGYLHLRDFEGRSALKTWFTRVVLNAALMIRRKRKPVHQHASETEWRSEEGGQWVDAIPSPEPDPETSCAKAEALGLIEELTAELRPTLRQAFSMYYREEMSVPQARLVAGVPTSAFKARLFRARRQVMSGAKRALVLRPQKRMSDGFSLSAVS